MKLYCSTTGMLVKDCLAALRIPAEYEVGPRLLNMQADHAYVANRRCLTILEHKSPRDMEHYGEKMVDHAKRHVTVQFHGGMWRKHQHPSQGRSNAAGVETIPLTVSTA